MNVIRNILMLAKKDLKILLKDKGQVVVLFVLPLLISLMISAPNIADRDPVTTSGEPKLSIKVFLVNEDQGPFGAQVEEALRSIQPLRVQLLRSADTADKRVADGEAPAAIIIPADFTARINANQPIRVQLVKDPVHQVEAQVVAGILNEVISEFSLRAEIEYGIRTVYEKTGALEGAGPEIIRAAHAQTMGAIWTAVQEMRQSPAIEIQREDMIQAERPILNASGIAFGMTIPIFSSMFAFFLVGFMAESILKEKEAGSFRRLLAAPIHRSTVVAGKMLSFIAVVFLQMLVLFGVGSAFFDMPLGNSPTALLALTLALALSATGMGMLLGSLARTSKQAETIGMLLGFLLYFASGFTKFSATVTGGVAELSYQPEGIRFYISQLTPHAHAIDGYIKLILEGASIYDIAPNILVLTGLGTVFFLVAIWRFKFD